MRIKTTIAAVAALATLALATTAQAVPIRNFQMNEAPDGSAVQVTALVYSPPGAAGCGAYSAVGIFTEDGTVLRHRARRINVCRAASGDWTVGQVSMIFNTNGLQGGTYRIVVAAQQTVNGRKSFHAIARTRSI